MIMRHLLPVLVAALLLLAGPLSAREPVPDFGLMLNEDGDAIFIAGPDPDPAVSTRKLEGVLDDLKGQPVRTLVYNIGCGSDILHYPTQVGSTWGWRTSAGEKNKPWDTYLPGLRAATAAGFDSVRVAGDWSKRNGLRFVPSYRMNDSHYCANPQDNVLTGRFWVENQPRLTLGVSPVPAIENLKELLDFSHPEVRAYRLAIIREAAERYAHVSDGFQLDFMRQPALFPGAVTSEQGALITDLIADVRKYIDELGAKTGRRYALMVRVPATLAHCRKVGLDVPTWLKRGLVDVITPSQGMTLAHDMPVDEFVRLARPVGAKVYPAMLDRTQFAWPFVASPTEQSYSGTVSWDTAGQLARGAAVNYRAMGADGIELYNFNVPLSAASKESVLATADLTPAARGERVYAVTSRYLSDQFDVYDPPRQLAARLRAGRPVTLRLYVGEDVSAAAAKTPLTCALRIGVWLGGKTASSLGTMTVKLNGRTVLSGSPVERLTAVTGKQTRSSKHVPPPVQGYVQIPLEGPSLRALKKGWNELFIDTTPTDAQTKYTLCEVQVGVAPE